MRSQSKQIFRFGTFLGFLWLISFPYVAEEVFTSENALSGRIVDLTWGKDPKIHKKFAEYQKKLEHVDKNDHSEYVVNELKQVAEVYRQPLNQMFPHENKENIYSYLRSQEGYGLECNVIAVPL